MTETPGTTRSGRLRDLLLIAMLGAAAIGLVELRYAPRLAFSDEIVYATIARNFQEGRGLVASHYAPRSLLERGFPSLYVHMPVHPLLLAGSFSLLGTSERAAFAPSWIAYVGAALLAYAIGVRLGGRRTGLLGASLCLAWPATLGHAATVMSESTLAFLTVLYALAWLEAWRAPRWWWGGVLAVGLVVGMLHHETLLVLLPATLALGARSPTGQRGRFLGSFLVVFGLGLAFLVWPVHLTRATHPHFATEVLSNGDVGEVAARLAHNLGDNLLDIVRRRGGASGTLRTQLPYLGMLVLLAAWRWLQGPARALLLFTAAAFGLTFLGLAPLYPLVKVGPRPLIHLAPLMAALGAVLLTSIRPPRRAAGVGIAAITALGWLSAQDVVFMMRGRSDSLRHESALSVAIREKTRGLKPGTVLVQDAFLYAWDAYPVTVVVFGRFLDPEGFDAVDALLPLDAVALPEWGAPPRPPRLEPHLLARGYRLLGREGGLNLNLRVYAADRLVESGDR